MKNPDPRLDPDLTPAPEPAQIVQGPPPLLTPADMAEASSQASRRANTATLRQRARAATLDLRAAMDELAAVRAKTSPGPADLRVVAAAAITMDRALIAVIKVLVDDVDDV